MGRKKKMTLDRFTSELTSVSIVKRKRGRPDKLEMEDIVGKRKRGRGRPPKNIVKQI